MLAQQGEGPDSPEKVVQKAAVPDLFLEWFKVLCDEHIGIISELEKLFLRRHVVEEVMLQIGLDELLLFAKSHQIC